MRKLSYPGRSNVLAQNGMVATSNPLSSMVAINVLQKGGNAVDAAIAAAAVQAVVCPSATGIGGDCFAIISMNGKKPIAVNGSGIAPKKAILQFYKDNKIKNIGLTSPHSVTIPGAVAAWIRINQDYGSVPMKDLLTPAINLAENGYIVADVIADMWKRETAKLEKDKDCKNVFLKGNKPYLAGDLHFQQALGKTLREIAKSGKEGFYDGWVAEDIVGKLNSIGGKHTLNDFSNL